MAVTHSGDADLSASPERLVFTAENWDTAQEVTVSAADDGDTLDGEATFGHVVTSNDAGYNLIATDSVTATEDDDDTPGIITVSTASLSVVEGFTGVYTVVLGAAPTAEVTVSVVRKAGATRVTVSPESLVFTAANWSRPQEVTVLAVEDDDELDAGATLVHAAAATTPTTRRPSSARLRCPCPTTTRRT